MECYCWLRGYENRDCGRHTKKNFWQQKKRNDCNSTGVKIRFFSAASLKYLRTFFRSDEVGGRLYERLIINEVSTGPTSRSGLRLSFSLSRMPRNLICFKRLDARTFDALNRVADEVFWIILMNFSSTKKRERTEEKINSLQSRTKSNSFRTIST